MNFGSKSGFMSAFHSHGHKSDEAKRAQDLRINLLRHPALFVHTKGGALDVTNFMRRFL